MAEFNTLTYVVADGVATITLNRPEAANGLSLEMARELMLATINADEDAQVRAIVLTATGKFFSAGGDLKEFAGLGERTGAAIKELTTYAHAAVSRLMRCRAPVVVAVNGVAAGAGFSLAMAGDLVLAARSAKFTMAYTAAALSPDVSASYVLPRVIGLRRTQELMLTNRRLSADEALDWGLLTQVVDDEELAGKAQALAAQLAQGPTNAFGTVKQLLLSSFDQGPEAQMELEARGIAALIQAEDGQEGMRAFLEKRAPNYQGK